MTRPMVTIINMETNETIVREMNDEEYAQLLVDQEAAAAAKAEEEAKATAKAELLAKLGITAEEAQLLLS